VSIGGVEQLEQAAEKISTLVSLAKMDLANKCP